MIPEWITDSLFNVCILVFGATVMALFRLSPGEDLSLVSLLPAANDLHVYQLPRAPEGFMDGEEDDDKF